MNKKISLVIPCYNEVLNIDELFARMEMVLGPLSSKYEFEFVFTDNSSTDGTFEKLREKSAAYRNMKVIRFSRNIGANRAIFTGLSYAGGDAVILLQSDLQDPPELIPQFVKEWEDGFDIVYGVIQGREENILMRSLRSLYYVIIDSFSDIDIPKQAGEFRLMSRRALEALLKYREDEMYIRGLVARIGFPQKGIPYHRLARSKGKTSTNLPYLIDFAINAFVSNSMAPLRMVTFVGCIFALSGFLFTAVVVLLKILTPESSPKGFATLACLITFFSGVQLLSIGILGEYLRRTYVQVLRRPFGFVECSINLGADTDIRLS